MTLTLFILLRLFLITKTVFLISNLSLFLLNVLLGMSYVWWYCLHVWLSVCLPPAVYLGVKWNLSVTVSQTLKLCIFNWFTDWLSTLPIYLIVSVCLSVSLNLCICFSDWVADCISIWLLDVHSAILCLTYYLSVGVYHNYLNVKEWYKCGSVA